MKRISKRISKKSENETGVANDINFKLKQFSKSKFDIDN